MGDTAEDDNQAFVVYVPPNGTDTSYESCLRLGAGPHAGATQDEQTTYNDIAKRAATIAGLSIPTYNPTSGIALLTPGTINLIATGDINQTSYNVTNSNTGNTYTVTQDANGGHIVQASYTNSDLGTWATQSFNQTTTVSTTFAPLQASINFVPSYTLSGPLVLQNNYGVIWNSTIGWSVQATMARVLNIGWRTVVSNTFKEGASNQYYTSKQAQSSAAQFQWTCPVRWEYLPMDINQDTYCKTVEIASLVIDALTVAYAAVGLGIADGGNPKTVQTWLVGSEVVAIACTALNGLLAASGIVCGALVDDYCEDADTPVKQQNKNATSFTISDGKAALQTGGENKAPSLTLWDADIDPKEMNPAMIDPLQRELKLKKEITLTLGDPDKDAALLMRGVSPTVKAPLVSLGIKDKGELAISDTDAVLDFGGKNSKVKIVLNQDSLTLTTDGHSIKMDSSGIKIAGQNITIEGMTASISSLQTKIDNMQQQVDKASQAAADAKKAVLDMQKAAARKKSKGK